MTEKIFCNKCNSLLYFGEIISHRLYMRAIPNEEAFLRSYNNRCPRCGASLSLDSVRIEIKERL
ncbi:MAG: hypothetical protein QXI32_04235 [Candidatus Bathyarchaeia archaeon]